MASGDEMSERRWSRRRVLPLWSIKSVATVLLVLWLVQVLLLTSEVQDQLFLEKTFAGRVQIPVGFLEGILKLVIQGTVSWWLSFLVALIVLRIWMCRGRLELVKILGAGVALIAGHLALVAAMVAGTLAAAPMVHEDDFAKTLYSLLELAQPAILWAPLIVLRAWADADAAAAEAEPTDVNSASDE